MSRTPKGGCLRSMPRCIQPRARGVCSSRPKVARCFRARTRCSRARTATRRRNRQSVLVSTASVWTRPHTVVWWSPEPQALSLNVQTPFGLRRDDLIVKDVQPEILRQGLPHMTRGSTGRAADIDAASRPSIDVITATRGAASLEFVGADEVPVTILSSPVEAARPGGARFRISGPRAARGCAAWRRWRAALGRLCEAHGRILGATARRSAPLARS